ncbi:GntR family transcriptional regulator [Nisaea nitritireducens]|uniref:GntR family transcriptional regulator n=1 Tax=Nisaea nitritireducens TaxID=568392 RepID=UPI001D02C6FD|nr:GntR family transcriptional regulator [Nisaea nitritireducens]
MDQANLMTEPLYKAVIGTVIDRIVSGELVPGAMLPSEYDLGAELGVSQGTARKALEELERRGIIKRRQGVGSFVAVRTPENALFQFFRLRNPDGTQAIPGLAEETVTSRKATASEAGQLSDAPERVHEIVRVRTIDGARLIYEKSVVPAVLFPGLAERAPLPNALYALYQQAFRIAIVRADESIRAVAADQETASALGIVETRPVMRVERKAFDIADRCVELRLSFYVTDHHAYGISLA